MKMGINKDSTPKKIKFLERIIDEVKHKKRPIRAEVMPCTVPAWETMGKDEGENKCEK
jgi:hypothetical protein